jgi:hypothetical protein
MGKIPVKPDLQHKNVVWFYLVFLLTEACDSVPTFLPTRREEEVRVGTVPGSRERDRTKGGEG